ncbi:Endoplasmic reticulum vesicle transporter, C-terminal [Dillenia turbinata]|uniref:Endoplasmic reticulum vesicle transporter, C-terminal n=1 Tax=Dillenia turbinata TaxID=194707 RepID=A0AAN8WBQ3_9MAGN
MVELADDDCCNSCEEVREAYRKKGRAMTNPDLIDQVGFKQSAHQGDRFGWATVKFSLLTMDFAFGCLTIRICKREGFLQKIKDEEGEGCNIHGFLEVNKVAGNFHFAPGKSFHQSGIHVYDLLAFQKDSYNISHTINRLAFGDYFPGVVNPLDWVQWVQPKEGGMYQYFIKRLMVPEVVPMIYQDIRGCKIQSNQMTRNLELTLSILILMLTGDLHRGT